MKKKSEQWREQVAVNENTLVSPQDNTCSTQFQGGTTRTTTRSSSNPPPETCLAHGGTAAAPTRRTRPRFPAAENPHPCPAAGARGSLQGLRGAAGGRPRRMWWPGPGRWAPATPGAFLPSPPVPVLPPAPPPGEPRQLFFFLFLLNAESETPLCLQWRLISNNDEENS